MRSWGEAAVTVAVAVAGLAISNVAAADRVDVCIRSAEEAQPLLAHAQLRAARESLLVCSQRGCPRAIRADCARWIQSVNRDLASVLITAVDPDGHPSTSVRVLVDGRVIEGPIDASELEVDPGDHTFRFELPGEQAVEQSVTLRRGEKRRGVMVAFVRAKVTAPAPVVVAAPSSVPAQASTGAAPTSRARMVVAGSLLGAAVLSAGLGAYGSLASSSAERTAASYRASNPRNACVASSSDVCRSWSDAVDAQDRNAALGTAFYIAGGALAVGALAAWVLWPSDRVEPGAVSVTPSVGLHGAGLDVAGSF